LWLIGSRFSAQKSDELFDVEWITTAPAIGEPWSADAEGVREEQ
jgi:hypothetical protein